MLHLPVALTLTLAAAVMLEGCVHAHRNSTPDRSTAALEFRFKAQSVVVTIDIESKATCTDASDDTTSDTTPRALP